MKFADTVLLRLAGPGTRAAVFDVIALEQFLSALYDTSVVTVQGPFAAVFDELRLGLLAPRTGTAEGTWGPIGSSDKNTVGLQVSGLGGDALLVDALWRGFIVARTTFSTGRITKVATAIPDPSTLDAQIVAALGALPADPVVRARERRVRLLAALQKAAKQPEVVTDSEIDRLLRNLGAASLNDWFENRRATGVMEAVQVTFDEPAPPVVSPRPLPVSAALLIRDAGFTLAQLLAESRIVSDQFEAGGLGIAQQEPKRRRNFLVVWVLPETVFDDAGWPGGGAGMDAGQLRQARRGVAGQWLAQEGIGLATVA